MNFVDFESKIRDEIAKNGKKKTIKRKSKKKLAKTMMKIGLDWDL
jgi:hypothetical protein